MNSTDLILNEGGLFLPRAVFYAAVGGAVVNYPYVIKGVQAVAKKVFSGFSYFQKKIGDVYSHYTPKKIQQGIEIGGALISHKLGGPKDPQASIQASLARLNRHDPGFTHLAEFLADQGGELYLKHKEVIEGKLIGIVEEKSYSFIGDLIPWFLDSHLIAQTIKANVLHILANLTDQGYEQLFQDHNNPLGRILTVLGNCFASYKTRLDASNSEEILEICQEMTAELLSKLFPKGADDLQLFHHTLPINLIKGKIWEVIQQQIPPILAKLYLETGSIAKEHPDWEAKFDQKLQGLSAAKLLKLPSALLNQYKEKAIPLMDQFLPALVTRLQKMGVQRADYMGKICMLFVKELLLSEDPGVAQIGSFFEKYFLERILFNLSNYSTPFLKIQDILKKETFPLPPTILEFVWPQIQKLQELTLPELEPLKNFSSNQMEVISGLDSPLFAFLRGKGRKLLDLGRDKLAEMKFSPSEFLNKKVPNQPFTPDFDKQFLAFIDKKNPSLKGLMDFGHHCAEAIIFQLCHDLFKNYSSINPAEDFSLWLSKEVAKALTCLSDFTPLEKESFKKALECHQKILFQKDPNGLALVEYQEKWKHIEPKLQLLTKNLFSILGYHNEDSLPVPKLMQGWIWNQIHSRLPKILFEEGGWLLQPYLEAENLKKEVQALPNGDKLVKGVSFFAQDVVAHLPEKLEGKISFSSFQLEDLVKKELISHIHSLLLKKNPAFGPIWKLAEGFIEAMMLKVIVRLNKLGQGKWDNIKTVIQEARKKLIAPSPDVQTIIEGVADQIFKILKIDEDLFGVPFQVRKLVLDDVKQKFIAGLTSLNHWDTKIRNHTKVAVGKHIPLSNMDKTIQTVIHYLLDKGIDHLSSKENGLMTPNLKHSFCKWLEKPGQKKYQLAGLFHEIVSKDSHIPFFEALFEMLDQSKSYKTEFVDWISPFLTNSINKELLPLLEKGSPDFDKNLLIAFLPIMTKHFKILNLAQKKGELTRQDILDAAGKDLHPMLKDPNIKNVLEVFYQNQTTLIFQALFPGGKKDLLKYFSIDDELTDLIWETAQATVATQIPQVLKALLDKDFLIAFLNESFEESIEVMNKKMEAAPVKKEPLFKEGSDDLPKLDRALGEFCLEAMQFLEMPFPKFENLPAFTKKIADPSAIDQKVINLLGKTVRKQFNEELLHKILRKVLIKLQKKKHVKMTNSETVKAKKKAELDLKKWERKLVEKSLEYGVYLFSYKIRPTEDTFGNKMIAKLVNILLSFVSLFFTHMIYPLLCLLKLDQKLIDYIFKKIDRATEKSVKVFSDPSLHENLLFSAADAMEKAG